MCLIRLFYGVLGKPDCSEACPTIVKPELSEGWHLTRTNQSRLGMSSHDRPRFSLSEVVAGAGWYPRFPVRFDSLSIIATKYLLSQVLGSDQFTVKLVRVTSYSRSLGLRETVTFGYRSASFSALCPSMNSSTCSRLVSKGNSSVNSTTTPSRAASVIASVMVSTSLHGFPRLPTHRGRHGNGLWGVSASLGYVAVLHTGLSNCAPNTLKTFFLLTKRSQEHPSACI